MTASLRCGGDCNEPYSGRFCVKEIQPRRTKRLAAMLQEKGACKVGVVVRMGIVIDAKPALCFEEFDAPYGVKRPLPG